jgi:hypothetical protein
MASNGGFKGARDLAICSAFWRMNVLILTIQCWMFRPARTVIQSSFLIDICIIVSIYMCFNCSLTHAVQLSSCSSGRALKCFCGELARDLSVSLAHHPPTIFNSHSAHQQTKHQSTICATACNISGHILQSKVHHEILSISTSHQDRATRRTGTPTQSSCAV